MSDTGGADKVFSNIRACLPAADAVCLWDETSDGRASVTETRLARSWLRGRKNLALPVMPSAWNRVSLEKYDTVVALSHAFAHHLSARAARSGRRAFSYVHTPARYIWAPDVDPRGRRPLARIGAGPLRAIDRRGIEPRVSYAANSEYIQRRIERCWGVHARVIYPPVDVERISSVTNWHAELDPAEDAVFHSLPTDGFILGASRLVKYKRLDRVIELGEALGTPVVIAGNGPALPDLQARAAEAKVPVYFTGRVADEMLYALYQAAMLYVFPGIEDFGIMPVESIAAGTPVLINDHGGARESVLALGGGAEYDARAGLAGMVEAAEKAMASDMESARSLMSMFSVSTFHREILDWTGSA